MACQARASGSMPGIQKRFGLGPAGWEQLFQAERAAQLHASGERFDGRGYSISS